MYSRTLFYVYEENLLIPNFFYFSTDTFGKRAIKIKRDMPSHSHMHNIRIDRILNTKMTATTR